MGRLLKLLFSRLAIVAALMLVQVGVLVAALVYFGSSYAYFQAVSVALSIVAIIYIINQNISPAYKIAWILPIAFLPVFGIPLYILFAKKPLPERKKQRLLGMLRRYGEAMRSVHSDSVELASEDVDAAMQSRYLERAAFASVFTGTDTEFFSPGERLYEAMLDKLRGAKRYIFMEYYIIEPGVMWDSILEILKQKVLEGVDVRLILPGIPDKSFPYALAFTHYPALLDAGVKIGEYTPGFVHAKVFVSDDAEAVVGTINLDYRSLYHHFECAAYLRDVPCIPQIQEDFEDTWSKCRMVTRESIRKGSFSRWLCGVVLKPLAPLM